VDVDTLKEALRRALSRVEKLRALAEENDRARADGRISDERHRTLHSFYESHLGEAERAAAQLRKEAGRLAVNLQRQVRSAINEQGRLVGGVREGRMSAHDVNKAHRSILVRLEKLKQTISTATQACSAASSADLGGFLDLPLEQYAVTRPQRLWAIPSGRVGVLVVMGALAALLVCAALAVRAIPGHARAAVEVRSADGPSGSIEVVCRNTGTATIRFVASWPSLPGARPGDATPGEEGLGPGQRLGVTLYTREKGSETFRLLPRDTRCWEFHGAPLRGNETLDVPPGLSITLTLDPRRLRDIGVEAERVRLIFAWGDGKRLSTYEGDVR